MSDEDTVGPNTALANAARQINPTVRRNPQRVLARIMLMFPDEFWASHPELSSLYAESAALLVAGNPDPDEVERLIKRIGELR